MEEINDNEVQPIMDVGTIFDWTPANTIVDHEKDMEHINSAMDDAKYVDSSEENNKELDETSNNNVKKWEDRVFLIMDGKHNLVMYDEVRNKNQSNKDDQYDLK